MVIFDLREGNAGVAQITAISPATSGTSTTAIPYEVRATPAGKATAESAGATEM